MSPKFQRSIFFIFLAIMAECSIVYASVLVKISSLSPINIGLYRIILALPIFYFLSRFYGKRFFFPLKDMFLMFCAGVFFGFDLLFFNIAIGATSVANVNLFASLVCFILIPIGVIFFKEKVKLSYLIGACIAIFGVFVLVGGKGELSVATPYGDMMAFFAVLCYGGFLALVYWLVHKYSVLEIMFLISLGSGVALLILALLFEGIEVPNSPKEWGIIFLIVLFGQVVGQGFFGYILGKLGSQSTSLLLLFFPVIAAIMGFVILGERLGIFEICGICIILLGVYLARREI